MSSSADIFFHFLFIYLFVYLFIYLFIHLFFCIEKIKNNISFDHVRSSAKLPEGIAYPLEGVLANLLQTLSKYVDRSKYRKFAFGNAASA